MSSSTEEPLSRNYLRYMDSNLALTPQHYVSSPVNLHSFWKWQVLLLHIQKKSNIGCHKGLMFLSQHLETCRCQTQTIYEMKTYQPWKFRGRHHTHERHVAWIIIHSSHHLRPETYVLIPPTNHLPPGIWTSPCGQLPTGVGNFQCCSLTFWKGGLHVLPPRLINLMAMTTVVNPYVCRIPICLHSTYVRLVPW